MACWRIPDHDDFDDFPGARLGYTNNQEPQLHPKSRVVYIYILYYILYIIYYILYIIYYILYYILYIIYYIILYYIILYYIILYYIILYYIYIYTSCKLTAVFLNHMKSL